jgi:hypothetical protein
MFRGVYSTERAGNRKAGCRTYVRIGCACHIRLKEFEVLT